jgi:septum formation protein
VVNLDFYGYLVTGLIVVKDEMMKLILASQSQGRAALLKAAGLRFRQIPSRAEEPAPAKGEALERHVLALACLKAEAVARRFPRAIVIGADTALILGDQIIGKPRSLADARRMLARLGRQPHRISSAACVIIPSQNKDRPARCIKLVESATVTLRKWTPARIRRHVALTRPLAWAGAYAVQDPCSAAIVRHIEGDLAPVIGLPLEAVLWTLENEL